MAASLEIDSSSSSEDEETLAKLKEAAVEHPSFVKYKTKSKEDNGKDKKDWATQEISYRPDKQKPAEIFGAVIETTPGVKKHIAKKLSAALDSEIDTSGSCFCPVVQKAPSENAGVRLFHQSTRYISTEEAPSTNTNKQKRRRPPSPSSDSSEDEKLAAAAVSADFILKQSTSLLPCNVNCEPVEKELGASQQEADSKISDRELDNETCDSKARKNSIVNDDETVSDKHKHKKKKKKKHKHTKCDDENK